MEPPEFRTEFDPNHGDAVEVADQVLRVTAPNPGPFTFHGTNSYVVGTKSVAVIDPGPEIDSHLAALMTAIGTREVSHIVVTHTHADHSPLARRLASETGAAIYAEGPHRAARPLHMGETNPLDAAADREFEPDIKVAMGDLIEGENFALEAVFTPGHTANHTAYALAGTNILFSGDHVMAWATSIVAPPDGSMSDYMHSLEALLAREETCYLPGHGGRLNKARDFVRALKAHRKMREAAVLSRLKAGDRTIAQLVAAIYRDTDPRLHNAAALSVLAHLEDLVAQGRAISKGSVSLSSRFEPA